jgi:shikimate kinase
MSDPATSHGKRTIVLVGLMGAGKSCIGRRLAQQLDLPFLDADREIEAAAGCTIAEIFETHGERAFRDGERRVILRLLDGPPHVLATGGGASWTRKRAPRFAPRRSRSGCVPIST